MRTKLVDAGYVILGADLLARELPAELQELIGEPTQRERKRDINSYRINEMPLLDDPRLDLSTLRGCPAPLRDGEQAREIHG